MAAKRQHGAENMAKKIGGMAAKNHQQQHIIK